MVKKLSVCIFAGLLAATAGLSLAFPVKTITIIVPFAPGQRMTLAPARWQKCFQ